MVPRNKQVIMISQTSTTNAGTAAGNCDTLGYDYAEIDIISSTSDNTTNNPSVLNLLESDDTVTTNFATVSGFVGDSDFTIPASVTAGNWGAKLKVDCRARKRYLRCSPHARG